MGWGLVAPDDGGIAFGEDHWIVHFISCFGFQHDDAVFQFGHEVCTAKNFVTENFEVVGLVIVDGDPESRRRT